MGAGDGGGGSRGDAPRAGASEAGRRGREGEPCREGAFCPLTRASPGAARSKTRGRGERSTGRERRRFQAPRWPRRDAEEKSSSQAVKRRRPIPGRPARPGPARLGSTRLRSAQLGSARLLHGPRGSGPRPAASCAPRMLPRASVAAGQRQAERRRPSRGAAPPGVGGWERFPGRAVAGLALGRALPTWPCVRAQVRSAARERPSGYHFLPGTNGPSLPIPPSEDSRRVL